MQAIYKSTFDTMNDISILTSIETDICGNNPEDNIVYKYLCSPYVASSNNFSTPVLMDSTNSVILRISDNNEFKIDFVSNNYYGSGTNGKYWGKYVNNTTQYASLYNNSSYLKDNIKKVIYIPNKVINFVK